MNYLLSDLDVGKPLHVKFMCEGFLHPIRIAQKENYRKFELEVQA
jgi:hypothetical protein